MNAEEAIHLVRRLNDAVANWQNAAIQGRGSKVPEKEARTAVKLILTEMTGKEPSDAEVEYCLFSVGMI